MSKNRTSHVVILGAGLLGLKAAYELLARGREVTVVEQEARVGGLCRSFEIDDLTFDTGPHLFYTGFERGIRNIHDEYNSLLEEPVVPLGNAINRSLLFTGHGRYTFHPLRLTHLVKSFGLGFTLSALWQVIYARKLARRPPPENARDLMVGSYGPLLYDEVFASYMRKSCGVGELDVDMRWVTEREYVLGKKGIVPFVLDNLKRIRMKQSGHVYPREGGAQAIANAYAKAVREAGGEVRLDARVTGLLSRGRRIRALELDTGQAHEVLEGDTFISSIPLPEMVAMIRPSPPANILEASRALSFRAMLLVLLRYRGDFPMDAPQLYIGSDALYSKRLSIPKRLSRSTAPSSDTGLCLEICTEISGPLWDADDDDLFAMAQQDLQRLSLGLDPAKIEGLRVERVPHAYPVYKRGFDKNRQTLLDYVDSYENLISKGRQGEFKYNIYTNQTLALAAAAVEAALSLEPR